MAKSEQSLMTQIKNLKEGECISRSVRVPLGENTPRNLADKIASIRNVMNVQAGRAKAATGNTYAVETGQFVNHEGTAVIATAILTCVENEEVDI